MGSMGFLLADWTIELLRIRRSQKCEKRKGNCSESISQSEGVLCDLCEENKQNISTLQADLNKEETTRRKIKDILGVNSLTDIADMLAAKVEESKSLQDTLDRLQEENKQFNEQIKKETDREETLHIDNSSELEKEVKERENNLLDTIKCLEKQLTVAKQEASDLTLKYAELQTNDSTGMPSKLQENVETLRSQLEEKKEEINQLTAWNNSLILESDQFKTNVLKFQVEIQKSEELKEVIKLKNNQMHQVLDAYDGLQASLDIEVAAHLACQQELEKAEWVRESFIEGSQQQKKHWEKPQNKNQSGHIVGIVKKNRRVAFSLK